MRTRTLRALTPLLLAATVLGASASGRAQTSAEAAPPNEPEVVRHRLVDELPALREAFAEALGAARHERGLSPLRHDPALDGVAQAHAEALLGALRAGKPASSVESLANRIIDGWRDPGVLAAGTTGQSAVYGERSNAKASPRLRVGQAIVVDALTADDAVRTALTAGASDLLGQEYVRLGIGVAFVADDPAPHTVWVACLLRRR